VILGGVGATFASFVLAAVARVFQRNSGVKNRLWVVVAAGAPFALLLYGVLAFGAYAVWCESTRGVDSGLGDSWMVPVGNGYRFGMIDIPEQCYLEGPSGEQFGQNLKRLGAAHDVIAWESEGTFHVLNTRTKSQQTVASEAIAVAMLKNAGDGDTALLEPSVFYGNRRWSYQDLIALVIAAIPPLGAAVFLSLLFGRSLRCRVRSL
jgi:hypothetical protein